MVLALSFARTPNREFNFREKWNLRVLAFLALCNTPPPPSVSLSFKPWFSRGAKDPAEIYLFVRLCRVLDTRDGGWGVRECGGNSGKRVPPENGEPYLPKRGYSRVCVRMYVLLNLRISLSFFDVFPGLFFGKQRRSSLSAVPLQIHHPISSSTERFNLWKIRRTTRNRGKLFARAGE